MGDSYHGQPVLATTPEFFEVQARVGRRLGWRRRAGDAGEGLSATPTTWWWGRSRRETGLKWGQDPT